MIWKLFGLLRAARIQGRTSALMAALLLPSISVFGFEPMTYLGFDETEYSDEAKEGLEAIFGGQIFEVSVPASTARLLTSILTAPPKSTGLSPGSADAWFYMLGRLPSPADRKVGASEGLGLGDSVFDRNGESRASFNCFTCHAGVVKGQVVAGLGNNHIMFSSLPSNQVSQPGSSRMRTRGDNYGPYEVWRLGAMLEDPANKGLALAKKKTEFQSLIESLDLPAVDPMPWWNMKYKKLNYWYSDGGSHSPENFSINFSIPHNKLNEHRAEHIKIVGKALAFARETVSPVFPETLDATLVRQGADLFHGRSAPADRTGFVSCKNCHGTYTKKPGHDDLSQPGSWNVDYEYSHILRNVKTDTTYNDILQQLRPIAEHGNKLKAYYDAQGTPELAPHAMVPDRPGYVAPPLVGIWASAPYFHNGSVPTLDTVLNSAERPEIWARDHRNPHSYDLARVGMLYRDVTREEFTASAAAASKSVKSQASIDHSAIYDTKEYAHGNSGHTFGDHLTVQERRAIIEFLKSLSGPDM